MTVADEIFEMFAVRGSAAYFGECVSLTQHCLQAAHFARAAGAAPPLVAAALLHDIGHLIDVVPDDIAEWVVDAHHEDVGGAWLARHFPAEVCEPVRLHVPAKRYLCATDPEYRAKLSAASLVTLQLQGGVMSPAEAAQFEAQPRWRAAVAVRRWDDQGKTAGLVTAGLDDYRELILRLARGRA